MTVLVAAVAGLHVVAGLLLVVAHPHWPMILGFAGLAYTLGMRHGFDADHIVAIDGTARHLLAKGKNANGVGLFFSLGHSTVVLLLALGITHLAQSTRNAMPVIRLVGGVVGIAASSVFMMLVALVNGLIFLATLRAIRRRSAPVEGFPRGVLMSLFGRCLRFVCCQSQMYGVGFLFGLGFDTASEIALLAIAATAAAQALPNGAVLVLPLSFAAGMALVDTAEGLFMVKACAWAQDQPERRARYNLVITGFTAAAAVTIGALELGGAVGKGVPLDSATIGIGIVAAFPLLLLAAVLSRPRQSVSTRASTPSSTYEPPADQ